MTTPQQTLLANLETALVGAPSIGTVIRGALGEVLSHLASSDATVALEYGPLDSLDPDGVMTFGKFRGVFELYLDVYWNGPPAVWETKVWQAYAEAWRRTMALTRPTGVLEVSPLGHSEPVISTEGDNQHVHLRAKFRVVLSHNYADPET